MKIFKDDDRKKAGGHPFGAKRVIAWLLGEHPGKMVAFIVLALMIAIFNPFGLYSYTSRESRDFVQVVMSHFYETERRNDISILMFDESSPAALCNGNEKKKRKDAAWPIDYQYHADVLSWIISYGKPRAVFVDLLYQRADEAGSGTGVLLDIAERYAGARVPLFFADVQDEFDDCIGRVRPELSSVISLARANGVCGPDNEGEVYALESPDACTLPPAAVMLYREACRIENRDCSWLDEAGRQAMYLQWGRYLDPAMATVNRPGETIDIPAHRPFLDSLIYLAHSMARGVMGEASGMKRPYHANVPVSLLVELRQADGEDARTWKKRFREIAKELFKDRYVLVGANIPGIPDMVRSPVHGNIPGVCLHAMALDNLLTYHENYWKAPGNIVGSLSFLSIIEILFLVAALRINSEMDDWIDKKKKDFRSFRSIILDVMQYVFYCLIMLIIAFCISTVVAKGFNIAPFNFIGIMALVMGLSLDNFLPEEKTGKEKNS